MPVAHMALYREFRPRRFSEVVGQDHIVRTLRNALVQQRIHHAYLLSGPRGTGKTTVARLLAKAVNCLNLQEGEPCNSCTACTGIMSGETMDIIEIDAASNRGIDEIRDLRDKVKYAPADLKRKVYIIDEVHMLSEPAFNALLKTLEEPPAHVMFVLATTEKQKLPVTIVSRCQSFEYHRLPTREIVEQLSKVCEAYKTQATSEALTAIARQAEGGMRDALSLLDQVMAYAVGGQITLEDTLSVLGSAPLDQFLKLDGHLMQGSVGEALLLLDELVRQGKDLRQFVRDYLTHMRDLLILKIASGETVLDLPKQALEALKIQAQGIRQAEVLAAIRIFSQLESDLRYSASTRLLVEVGLIRLAALYLGQHDATASHLPTVTVMTKAQTATKLTPAAADPTPASAPQIGTAPPPTTKAEKAPLNETVAQAPPSETTPQTPPGEAVAQAAVEPVGANPVSEAWPQILELVKKARISTHSLLTQARVGSVRGNTVYLVAPKALVDLLKRPADKGIIEKALERVGMEGMEIQPVDPEHPGAGSAEPQSHMPAGVQVAGAKSLLELAQSVFPKELVHEVEEEGSK